MGKSKNFGSWVYQLMIQFIVLSSFFLQDYISVIFSLVFFFVVFFFWGCSFPLKSEYFLSLRVSEIHLFYNLQLFSWHFLEFFCFFFFRVFSLLKKKKKKKKKKSTLR